MSFAAQLKAFENKTNAKLDALTKEVVGQLAMSLILESPVGDPAIWKSKPPASYTPGRFRANWQYGLGELNPVTTNVVDPDGGDTLARIYDEIPDEAGGKVHFLSNSLPYAIRLEQDAWSTQAPLGMVTLTVIEFQQIVGIALRTINGRSFGSAGELGV